MPQLVALADALAHPGEHRHPLVQTHDGVHELHDQHRLADPGATEQAGLAPTDEGAQEIDHLDAGGQQVADPGRLRQGWRGGDDGAEARRYQRRPAVQRPAEGIQQASQAVGRDRHLERAAGIEDRHLPPQTAGAVQGDGAGALFVQMPIDLEGIAFAVLADIERPVQWGQAGAEDVDDRSMDFLDHTQCRCAWLRAAGSRGRGSPVDWPGGWSDQVLEPSNPILPEKVAQ